MSNNESKKIDRRIHKTKTAIHTALLELMEDHDISGITVTELTDLADVNRKTFYNHYTDITDIIDEMENDWTDHLLDILTIALNPYRKYHDMDFDQIKTHAREVSIPFFKTTITELKDNPSWFKIIEATNGHNNLLKKIVSKEKKLLLNTFGSSISNNIWLDYFLIFTVNGALAMIEEWHKAGFPMSVDELAEFFQIMFTSDASFEYIWKKF